MAQTWALSGREEPRTAPWCLAQGLCRGSVIAVGRGQVGGEWSWYGFGDGYRESSSVRLKFEMLVGDIQGDMPSG